MKNLKSFYLDIENIFMLKGLLHIYMVDMNNTLLRANDLQLDFMDEVANLKKELVIGSTLEELFNKDDTVLDIIYRENRAVTKTGTPKQFYNHLEIKNGYEIQMLTTKLPLFKGGKISGIFGISQYVSSFSKVKALKSGLSKREVECLSYVLEGYSNKQIATLLNLSSRTVEQYIDNTKNKLGCSSRYDLILTSLQKGLKRNFSNDPYIFKSKLIKISSEINCISPDLI